MQTLTKTDYDVLLEAVDAWKGRDAVGKMLGGMFAVMGDKSRTEKEDAIEKAMAGDKELEAMESETATLLKAKLIHLRRQAEATEATVSD